MKIQTEMITHMKNKVGQMKGSTERIMCKINISI